MRWQWSVNRPQPVVRPYDDELDRARRHDRQGRTGSRSMAASAAATPMTPSSPCRRQAEGAARPYLALQGIPRARQPQQRRHDRHPRRASRAGGGRRMRPAHLSRHRLRLHPVLSAQGQDRSGRHRGRAISAAARRSISVSSATSATRIDALLPLVGEKTDDTFLKDARPRRPRREGERRARGGPDRGPDPPAIRRPRPRSPRRADDAVFTADGGSPMVWLLRHVTANGAAASSSASSTARWPTPIRRRSASPRPIPAAR